VQSPALNPLDEWRPRDRQIVAGAEAAWMVRALDLRGEYRREIDPRDNSFVSERASLSFAVPVGAIRIAGGAEYDIAMDQAGSADLTLTWVRDAYSIAAGVRRHRPYFSLWTLWGAFSPVPYNAATVSGSARATSWLSLHARGERYRFADTEVSTGLVPQLERDGWRATLGGTATLGAAWTADASYHVEHGPGAAGSFADAAVRYASTRYSIDAYAGALARPLELRFYDATSRWIGARAEWQLTAQRRVWADVALVDDDRDRPDNAASSLDQFRLRGGVSVSFGSGADRSPLPPGRPPQ
jgi:hypothetical protein